MISCEPIYTGGGITCFLGQIDDGLYFMADNSCYDVMFLNADPMLADEDCWYAEWQEFHLVRYLDEKESLAFFRKMFEWIKANNHDHYEWYDCDSDLEEVKRLEKEKNWR